MADNDETETAGGEKLTEPVAITPMVLARIFRAAMPVSMASLAVLAFLYTMYFAAELLLPVVFAAFFSIILRPLVQGMKNMGIPETCGSIIVVVAMFGALAGAAAHLYDPAEKWVQRLPNIQQQLEMKLWPVTRSIEQAKKATEKIEKLADGGGAEATGPAVRLKGPSLLERAFETTWLTLVQFLIVTAMTFLFLSQPSGKAQERLKRLPWRRHRESINEIFTAAQRALARFLQISAAIYLVLGILTGLAMYGLGMPTPILWGVMAAVLGFMPYVGPVITFVCIATVSLLSFDNWWHIAAPPAVYLFLTTVEGYFITPTILGKHLTLSPISVFLSMLLWTWVWGVAGALLAVPILLVTTIVARQLVVLVRHREEERAEENRNAASPSHSAAEAAV